MKFPPVFSNILWGKFLKVCLIVIFPCTLHLRKKKKFYQKDFNSTVYGHNA